MVNSTLFGGIVRAYRQKCGLTQKQLAVSSGISRRHIIYIEKGERSAPLNTAVKLLDVLAKFNIPGYSKSFFIGCLKDCGYNTVDFFDDIPSSELISGKGVATVYGVVDGTGDKGVWVRNQSNSDSGSGILDGCPTIKAFLGSFNSYLERVSERA